MSQAIFAGSLDQKVDTPYKTTHNFKARQDESQRILSKYPDKIAVIVERLEGSNVPLLNKKKYLVPGDLSMGQFLFVIRRQLKLDPSQAIFLFVNNNLAPSGQTMFQTHKENKDDDGFLYVYYSGESTFGA